MSKSKISYLCNRCKHGGFDLDAECLVCDRGSRFVEVKRGPETSYARFYDSDAYRAAREASKNHRMVPGIDRVIFADPATIVYWWDGVKTVVKCQEGDTFDPELGLAMAIAKRALGNTGNYNNVFKKWLPEEDE